MSVIILQTALNIPYTINMESTLSYLGLGLGIDTPSLGLLLAKVRTFFLDYPYLLIFPASIVSIISISFYSWATPSRTRPTRAITFKER